jgi:hypothetical protein
MGFGSPDSWFPNKETTVAICTTLIAAVVALYVYKFINQRNYSPRTHHVASEVELIRLCEEIKDEPLSTLDHNIRHVISEDNKPGPRSFYFKSDSVEKSALVSASRYGRIDVVKYFLNNYGKCVQLDQTANLDLPVGRHHSMREVHSCSSLYAACFNGSLETVSHLLKAKADINQSDCLGRTPLQIAAQRGHMMLVQDLISNGADVNSVDVHGYTPLLTAVSERQVKVVKVLLESKADLQQCANNGYSPLHIAAENGMNSIIQMMLSHDSTLAYQRIYDSKHKLACPLYLASSRGHIQTSRLLMETSKCSPAQMPDVLLLWGAALVQPQHQYIRSSVQRYWLEAMELKQQHISLPTTPAMSIEAYEYRIEMCTIDEVMGYFSSQIPLPETPPSKTSTPSKPNGDISFSELASSKTLALTPEAYTEICYQSLLILERCLGYGDPLVIKRLLDVSQYMLVKRKTAQCEQLLCRALEMSIDRALRYKHADHCQNVELEYEIKMTLKNLCNIVDEMYRQSCYGDFKFSVYLQYTMLGMDSLTREGRYDCTGHPAKINEQLILLMLALLAAWVYQKNLIQSQELRYDSDANEIDECDGLAHKLVQNHLFICNDSTLLHLAVAKLGSRDSLVRDYIYLKDLGLFIYSLLSWGASEVVDLPNSNGDRPLHLAASRARSEHEAHQLIQPLLQYGAHIDSINASNKTPYGIQRLKPLQLHSPMNLKCLCYRALVTEPILYDRLPLVEHFTEKDRINLRLHDPRCAREDYKVEFDSRLLYINKF